jgi:hypothetical protein
MWGHKNPKKSYLKLTNSFFCLNEVFSPKNFQTLSNSFSGLKNTWLESLKQDLSKNIKNNSQIWNFKIIHPNALSCILFTTKLIPCQFVFLSFIHNMKPQSTIIFAILMIFFNDDDALYTNSNIFFYFASISFHFRYRIDWSRKELSTQKAMHKYICNFPLILSLSLSFSLHSV